MGAPLPFRTSQRGFACVGLIRPKTPANVGGVLRAAHVYGAAMVAIQGDRTPVSSSQDTTKAWRHIPIMRADDLMSLVPYDAVPVAVDLVEGARALPKYRHPERAFYIFGPEDGTIGRGIIDRCRDRIAIPTKFCMNLAATVNVILYDRMSKQGGE